MNIMIYFDMIQTVAFAAVLLFIGSLLCKKISLLNKYNIPAPVVGGLVFAFVNWGLQSAEIGLRFDTTLQSPFMIAFFTTIGMAASLKMLKEGGPQLVVFLIAALVLLILQNMVAWGLSLLTGLDPMLGLLAGSITMSGGHGTGATVANFFTNQFQLAGAMELAMAAATFGLIAGSLIGGPVARRLIIKKNLAPGEPSKTSPNERSLEIELEAKEPMQEGDLMRTVMQLTLAMSAGAVVFEVLNRAGIMVPTYLFSLFFGIIIRNIAEYTGWYRVNMRLIENIGSVSLSLFLAMALMSLRLWQLVELAVPMLVILLGEVTLMITFAYFITFNFNGRDYDAAVLSAGHCGFGLGATPNAIANMQAVTNKYGPAPRAFFLVSIVGAFFIDIANAFVIQTFVSFIQR